MSILLTAGEAGDNAGATSRVEIFPLVETATGLLNVRDIADWSPASDRVPAIVFGSGAFCLDLQVDRDNTTLPVARSTIVTVSRAAGLQAPIDGPYGGPADADGLLAACRASRSRGFGGRVVVYPPRIPKVHKTCGRSPGGSSRTPNGWWKRSRRPSGTAVPALVVEGRFVDYASYRRAQTIIDTARSVD